MIGQRQPPAVRVQLLGGFGLAVDDRPAPEQAWRLRKARTLVKLLALAPGHRLHREQAIEVLWPGRPAAAAANNLHQVLHAARRQLAGGDRLRLDDDVLVLCAGEPLWVDAEAFRAEATAALRSGDADRARAALALYRGELLPEDLYEDWTEPTRGELERLREELELLADLGTPAAPSRDNLPAELTTFIGREAELEDIGRLLGRGPLVMLTGPAGCGKTRLALEAGARQRERFRDGVWLVELAPLSQPELVADAVAAAVGVTPGRRTAAAALAESLATREALLILDSCEHVVGAVADLAGGLLRVCPDLQVLATSREALGITGEIVWRVPSLSLPEETAAPAEVLRSEAGRLFTHRAAAADPRFALTEDNAGDVARICRGLDGVPLAIELAAARVGALPPAEIARRLGGSLRLLRSRQQTLEAALDWSFRLLDAEEAALLPRLAVFAGSFGLDAAEDVCGEMDVLLRLVGKSLVVAGDAGGEPRFRLLEMVRQYAGLRLHDAEALRERHAHWYAELADHAGDGRLDLEADNLRAALGWLLDHHPAEALRLASRLSRWWLLRGRLVEGREWLQAAVARTAEPTPATAAAMLAAVGLAGRAGELGEGEALVERSLEISRDLGDRDGIARALHMRGLQFWLRGDFAAARGGLHEARAAGSPATEPNATHALGILAICARDLPEARRRLEETLELVGDAPFLVVTPGFVPIGAGAEAVQEESQIGFRSVQGRRTAAAYVRMNLALLARLEGDPARAGVALAEALAALRASGDDAGVAQALAATGRLETLHGDAERARAALRESLAIRRRLGDVRSVGLTLGLLAELERDRAPALLSRALVMFREAGDRPGVLWMLLALARLGRDADARLQEALAICEALGAVGMRAWTLTLLAGAQPDRAPELIAEARREFERCGDGWGIERCEALAKRVQRRATTIPTHEPSHDTFG